MGPGDVEDCTGSPPTMAKVVPLEVALIGVEATDRPTELSTKPMTVEVPACTAGMKWSP
jgi:hypothetical protein